VSFGAFVQFGYQIGEAVRQRLVDDFVVKLAQAISPIWRCPFYRAWRIRLHGPGGLSFGLVVVHFFCVTSLIQIGGELAAFPLYVIAARKDAPRYRKERKAGAVVPRAGHFAGIETASGR
jgi:hypothetical protein